MAYSFDDKVAIVTGGSRGIGEATARLLVERGAKVVIADVLESEGMSLAAELGERAIFQKLDVSVQADWEATLRAACEFGVLSVLVNNAAILIQATVLDMTEEQFVSSFRVNQLGVFLGMRAVFPALKEAGGGAIVNVSSIDGLQSMNSLTAYSATKWAVRGMTKAAAIEMGKYGIRVNSVHPGGIYTPMHASELISVEEASTFYTDSALPRVGMPEEIARMIAFVASDESSFSTGAEFIADGGTSAGKLNRIAPQL
ncbi:3-alpha-(or 20-beta)-hydroxysteroid dehydrogenase [Halioglobus japonicus]|nr:3-alpha-(or 20-beta)-hydroxysteroid dehydrogenase [Halioglobus japonicus]